MVRRGHIETVLAATDLSEAAESVVEWAARIAEPHGARIVVHHGLTGIASPAGSPGDGGEEGVHESTEDASARLDEIVEGLRARGLAVEGDLQPEFGPSSILRRVGHFDADVVVAGTRAPTRVRRVLLGSTATRLVRDSPVPVLVVPPSTRTSAPHVRRGIRAVLVPTDFVLDLQKTIEAIETVLGPGSKEATATLLHVQEPTYEPASPWRAPLSLRPGGTEGASAARRLEALADRLEHDLQGIDTVTCGGDAARAIEREAQYRDADLIVMTHGRPASSHLLRTSTIERVLATAPCPVLALRSDARAAERRSMPAEAVVELGSGT